MTPIFVLSTKDEVVKYVLRTFDTNFALTLGEAWDANLKYPRKGFAGIATQLISEGFLTGRGDGFGMRYSLTKKGRAALDQTRDVDPDLGGDAMLKRENPIASGTPKSDRRKANR